MKKIFWNFIVSNILLLLLTVQAQATSISIPLGNLNNLSSFSGISLNTDGSYSNNYGVDINLTITDNSSSAYATVIITQGSSFSVTSDTNSESFTIYQNGDTLFELVNGQVPIVEIPDPYTESVAPTIDTHISNDIIQDTIINNPVIELPQTTVVVDNEIQEEYEPHDIELVNIDTDLYTQDTLYVQVKKQQSKLISVDLFEDEEDLEDSKAFKDLVGNDIITAYIIAKVKLDVEIKKLKEKLNDKTN